MNPLKEVLSKNIDNIFNRHYNVEFKQSDGKYMTFNNILVGEDDTYFWFLSKENGLTLVRQDRVTFMYCADKRNHFADYQPNNT
jgi:hypothetical protein